MKVQEITKKVVFNEADNKSKAVFGTLVDKGEFVEVTTSRGDIFTINKNSIVFIKEGGY